MIAGIIFVYVGAFFIAGATNNFLTDSIIIASVTSLLFMPFIIYIAINWFNHSLGFYPYSTSTWWQKNIL